MPCRNWPITLLVGILAPLTDGSEYRHAAEPAHRSILIIIAGSFLCTAFKHKVKQRIHHYDSSKRTRLTWKKSTKFVEVREETDEASLKVNCIQRE